MYPSPVPLCFSGLARFVSRFREGFPVPTFAYMPMTCEGPLLGCMYLG